MKVVYLVLVYLQCSYADDVVFPSPGVPSLVTGSVDIPRIENITNDSKFGRVGRLDLGDLAPSAIKPIFPGTKWCGSGDNAKNQSDLGMFEDTDKCCREHDMCPDIIEAGNTKYGLTNTAYYTRLLCKCDEEFLKCLKKDNSVISRQIGYTYFNVLRSVCFRKDYPIERCARQSWILQKRCLKYEYDKSRPKVYQWFDNPFY